MKKEMNNKGFSLVELIIVIAIMVILIAVLAPTYLRYVERGRNSRDISNATSVVDAIQVYASDPQATTPFTAGTTTLTFDNDAATNPIPAGGTNATAIAEAFANAGLVTTTGTPPVPQPLTTTCASRTAWTEFTIDVIVAPDGNISFTYGSNSGATPDTFANMMAGN